jgi:hypothetical protein
MTHHSLRHYDKEHYQRIEKANTYEEVCSIAMDVLKKMPKPISIICGPISTGGAGNVIDNLKIYEGTIFKLSAQNKNIFNQMPFMKSFDILTRKFGNTKVEKNQILLDKFYQPIYESKIITKMYFIHGWESSHGARWEREIAKKHNITIEDLPEKFLEL